MARNEAYRKAVEAINAVQQSGAKVLKLGERWNSKDSEKLSELPESLSQLTWLQSLDLSGNLLTVLPDSLGELKQLQTLDLEYNRLAVLPDSLGELNALQILNVSDNRLSTLPQSLGKLVQLKTLEVSNNRLTLLPESLGRLSKLQTLDLSGNQLTAFQVSLSDFKQLMSLDLSENLLTVIPEGIGNLDGLNELSVSSNPIDALPKELGALSRLRSLTLANTNVAELPDTLKNLESLRFLSIGRTLLRHVPYWFDSLTSLTGLDLSNTGTVVLFWTDTRSKWQSDRPIESDRSFSELPQSLTTLPNLRQLYLHGNDALNIPVEILGPNWDSDKGRDSNFAHSILEYYFSTRDEQGRALRELKLIVVGRGGAGKTSLIRRLDGKGMNPTECETHGINISQLSLDCTDGPVTTRIWDFGGQHVLHAMHEFFLTARSLYLLVLGEREDMAERDAAYWLQLIRSYAGNAPVVVALNKNQGRPREMDRASLERNYGPILAWVATDCADGFDHTIADLRNALTAAAEGIPEIRQRFPTKWWKIKEWLENMSQPYMSFADYQERCRELNELDGDNQEKLAGWLNDLGIAINYTDDERLHDTTVLRPDWLANGIYAILRANDSAHERHYAPDAMLTEDLLGPIYEAAEKLKMLNTSEYPCEMWPFLLRLMDMFQLAFPIDDRGRKLLVPNLLPLEPPDECDEPQDVDRTRLRYEFAVVPGPLLPKLLVRMFSLIDGKRCWRRGAILRYGVATARVWTTQDERWIRITAVGARDDRDELLTMTRCTLSELFDEYKNLQAIEQWEDDGDWVPRRRLEREGKLPSEYVDENREEVQ